MDIYWHDKTITMVFTIGFLLHGAFTLFARRSKPKNSLRIYVPRFCCNYECKIIVRLNFVLPSVILKFFQIIPKMITFLWFSDEVKVLLDMVVYNTTNSYTNTSEELLLLQKYTTTARLHLNESSYIITYFNCVILNLESPPIFYC